MAVNQESSNNNLRPLTHVVFDMDGVLLDSETCWTQAANNLMENLELPLTRERFEKQVDEYIEEAMKEVKMMPGVERLVKHLHKNKIPMAIATGITLTQFYKKTARFGDFFTRGNYFSHVVTFDNPAVKRWKPAPDCFLVAANRIQSKGFKNPKEMYNVLVFENSPQGVAAAISAGMQCVMVLDPRVDQAMRAETMRAKDMKAKATLVIRSMYYFIPALFSLDPFEDNKFGCNSP